MRLQTLPVEGPFHLRATAGTLETYRLAWSLRTALQPDFGVKPGVNGSVSMTVTDGFLLELAAAILGAVPPSGTTTTPDRATRCHVGSAPPPLHLVIGSCATRCRYVPLSAAWCRLARRFSHRFQRPIRPTFSVLPDYPQGPMISPARALLGRSKCHAHRPYVNDVNIFVDETTKLPRSIDETAVSVCNLLKKQSEQEAAAV